MPDELHQQRVEEQIDQRLVVSSGGPNKVGRTATQSVTSVPES